MVRNSTTQPDGDPNESRLVDDSHPVRTDKIVDADQSFEVDGVAEALLSGGEVMVAVGFGGFVMLAFGRKF